MDGPEQVGNEDAVERILESVPSVGLSRREFSRRIGTGSAAAAVGLVWAAPKISTIRYATKVVAGSPPPATSTTTSTTPTSVPVGRQGGISVSTGSPCAGDNLGVSASGFVPHTAVRLELDSAENSLGVTTADRTGSIDVSVHLSSHTPAGPHTIRVVGVQSGGRTLTLRATITIRSEEECRVGTKGSTTTTPSTTHVGPRSTTPGTTATSPITAKVSTPPGTSEVSPGTTTLSGGALAFTGTDAVDLALIGAAAAVGGRALYGLARRGDDDLDEFDN